METGPGNQGTFTGNLAAGLRLCSLDPHVHVPCVAGAVVRLVVHGEVLERDQDPPVHGIQEPHLGAHNLLC